MRTLFGSCHRLTAILLFTVSATLVAQAARPSSTLMMQQPLSQDCPVALHADHVPGGAIARAEDSRRASHEPLRISFRPTDAHGVVQAELVLHGMSGSRVVPAGSQAQGSSTESFSVSPTPAASHYFDTVVYPHKLTAVEYLEVKSMTFADGTVWHASPSSTCRVAPDGFTPVAAGK